MSLESVTAALGRYGCPGLVVFALVIPLSPPTAAALDSCSVAGPYFTSVVVDAPPFEQFLGSFDFTPPAGCSGAGTVSIASAVSYDRADPTARADALVPPVVLDPLRRGR